ncbi:hypothetical protein AB0C52_33355 [Streptomyces sp. NPDC048717]|uniref:hypothetical protein n=1 Tax=Streptomyces sp. NPDC048717 TaxID=3154928 RepID=UPI003419F17C
MKFTMRRGPGRTVVLAELLALVPDNDWAWSLLEYDGVGSFPDGLTYQEFQDLLLAVPEGLPMTWERVRAFAAGLDQCWDLILVAAGDRARLAPDRLAALDFGGCLVVFEAIDSGSWEVTIADGAEGMSGLVATLRDRYGAEAGAGAWGSA